MRPELRETLDALPEAPGVYLMKSGDEIFYIGKAKNIRQRWRSYISGADNRAFVALLDQLLTDVECLLTATEKEALLLEDQLVKRHRPRFNVKLTDDKHFLCLRLDTRKDYPRLQLVRRFGRDGAKYFGPYHSATSIRETLRIINRHFQLRTCSDQVMRTRTRPCLQYQIKRCPAPCVYDIREEYAGHTANVTAFLEGRHQQLVEQLEGRMQSYAAREEFELAAQVRDQLRAVSRSLERQRVATPDRIDRDVIGLYREGPEIEIHVMRTRDGNLIGARRLSLTDREQPTTEILADFVPRYYGEAKGEDIPREILLPEETGWGPALEEVLGERAARRVGIMTPRRGDKRRLVTLAGRNARQAFLDKRRQRGAADNAMARLQKALHLERKPERIECVDISHLQGEAVVGSVVRLEYGISNSSLYRHYKVRSVRGQDDFKSMYEVVSRRARRGLEESDLPDLLVIDGGKGQLGAARAALDDHGIDTVDLVGLAKERGADQVREKGARPERVFLHGRKNPVVLRANSAELFLITHARDEAHRFAIAYNRKLRRKKTQTSILDTIPGVGPKRRNALLKKFGSVARIRRADPEAIAEVVGPAIARAVVDGLSPKT